MIVKGTPTRANSINVRVSPLFSAFWMMITLLAAPRIVRLPASVLPAASAMSCTVVPPACWITGWKRATKGTFEMNWLMMTLVPRMTGTEEILLLVTNVWKNPVCQTVSIKTNIAAKKTSVGQSMARRMANRRGEKKEDGCGSSECNEGQRHGHWYSGKG